MQSDCLDQHAITNSAKRIGSKSEMPSYRLKFPLFSTRTEKDTAWDGYTMNFWTVRGFQVNHKRVQRIMNQLALFGKRPKEKYHSYKGDVGKAADNIINRDFSTEKPLQKWTTDVSQFNFPRGQMLHFIDSGYEYKWDHFLQSLDQSQHGGDKKYAEQSIWTLSFCTRSGHALGSGMAVPARILSWWASEARNHSIHVPKG